MKAIFVSLITTTLPLLGEDFVNLGFDVPDLSGSLTPVEMERPQGPFFGEASRILRGWTLSIDGNITMISGYTPWPPSSINRTITLSENRPEEQSELGGRFHLNVDGTGIPIGTGIGFELQQTGTIPLSTAGLRVGGSAYWRMLVNDEVVGDALVNQVNPVDVSRFAGQTVNLEFIFPRGTFGTFDIFGFTQIPEPSTWALFGVGAAVMGWAIRQRRSL